MDEPISQVRALYDEHGGDLLRYLKRLTGHTQVAEDLLHDTFVQAMRGLEQLRRADSPRAWLFSIARHLGLNVLGRRRVVVPLSETVPATPIPAEEDTRREQVRRAIAALPAPQQEALQLRLRVGLTYEEIAQVLGIPVGTVRSRLHNAVRNLRHQLTPGLEED
jgi:RNA polymerase sigma-70 factor, ECF subfamily